MSDIKDSAAETPSGIDHIVLHVRDLDASHAFWTDILGFRHVGTMRRNQTDGSPPIPTRFYSGARDGKFSHHNVALVEEPTIAVRADRIRSTILQSPIPTSGPGIGRSRISPLAACPPGGK